MMEGGLTANDIAAANAQERNNEGGRGDPPQGTVATDRGAGAQGAGATTTAPAPEIPTLRERLKGLADEGAGDEEVEAELVLQGTSPPTDIQSVLEGHLGATEPMVLCGMEFESSRISLIHSLLRTHPGRRAACRDFDGKVLGAVGDRGSDGTNPPFVKLKETYFAWRKVRLPRDKTDNGPLAQHAAAHPREFCALDEGELDVDETSIPKLGLVPAAVAEEAAEAEATGDAWTPMDLHERISVWELLQSQAVQDLVAPTKNWCLAAAMVGTATGSSKMAYPLTTVTGAPERVRQAMRDRIDQTLGRIQAAPPQGPPPDFSDTIQCARAALEAMSRRQTTSRDVEEAFQSGVDRTMRMFAENRSAEERTKGFSDIQKGKLMG